ncbi:MAG: hypothetical protein AAGJ80_01595 [Cyanobacteria bacterium J06553_1]
MSEGSRPRDCDDHYFELREARSLEDEEPIELREDKQALYREELYEERASKSDGIEDDRSRSRRS